MSSYDISLLVYKWFEDLLDNRRQVKTVNNVTSSGISLNNIVPQSSTSGPLLSLMHINDIDHKCKIYLFADDTLVYCCSDNLNEMIDSHKSELPKISRWCNHNVSKLNDNKTIMNFKIE